MQCVLAARRCLLRGVRAEPGARARAAASCAPRLSAAACAPRISATTAVRLCAAWVSAAGVSAAGFHNASLVRHRNLTFMGTLQDAGGTVIRAPGTTRVTGTVTSGEGTYTVDILL